MSESPDFLAALKASQAAIDELGDPFTNRLDHCPGCEGRGVIQTWGYTHDNAAGFAVRGVKYVECWDCGGTGKGDPTEEKDISYDE